MSRKRTENKDYSKSAGQTELYEIVKALYPHRVVKQDINLRKLAKKMGYSWIQFGKEYGVSLSPIIADIVIFDDPLIILEYNGAQHYKYTSHWHGNIEGYKEAQERDNQKIWLCQRLFIPMITIAFNEEMTKETVEKAIKSALKNNKLLPGYKRCSECNGIHLQELLENGICKNCITKIAREKVEKEKNEQLKKENSARRKEVFAQNKELNKEKNKELYLQQREFNKERNKELLEQLKETNKEIIAEQKLKQKEKNKEIHLQRKATLKEDKEYQEKKEQIKQQQKEKIKEYKNSESYKNRQEELKQRQKEYKKSMIDKMKGK